MKIWILENHYGGTITSVEKIRIQKIYENKPTAFKSPPRLENYIKP